MRQASTEINPPPLIAANNNRPIRWDLETNGLTPGLVSALGELLSCAASYAPTKRDRKDLQTAAALTFDTANRMSVTPQLTVRSAHG